MPGHTAEITPHRQVTGRERFDERLAQAERIGNHLWNAIVFYLVTDPTAEPLVLDQENIGGPPLIGCYRCEEPYSPRLARRRCSGTRPMMPR